jgi:hypothetical protein
VEYLPDADRSQAAEALDQPAKTQGRFKLFGKALNLANGSVA